MVLLFRRIFGLVRRPESEGQRTLKLVLGGLCVSAGAVEVVADTASGSEAEEEGSSGLGHDFGLDIGLDVRREDV